MEQTKFKNRMFEYSLIGYLISILCWNLYNFKTDDFVGLIPIGIQGILLYLIFSKNKYVKNGIKIWSIILILSYGLSLIAKLIKIVLADEIIFSELMNKAAFLTIGILIYVFNEKYVELVKSE